MNRETITPAGLRGEGQIGYRQIDGLRDQRLVAYEVAKGRHYMRRRSNTMADLKAERQPVNLTQQQWRTLIPFLTISTPQADVTPRRSELDFEAGIRKAILDQDSERMNLDEVYQDAATEAIFSGIAFTINGIKAGGETYLSKDRRIDIGQEYTRLIDIDDVSLDPMARTIPECRFIAHRYTVARQDAINAIAQGVYGATPEQYEDGMLPNPNIATPQEAEEIFTAMQALEHYGRHTTRVDDTDADRVYSGTRLDETVCLWDFVLYIHGEVWIATLPANPGIADPFPPSQPYAGGDEKFLAFYRWRGPESGPINTLTFLRVPFNKIPVALEQMQRDLAEVSDLIANKVVRQLLRTKMLTVYDGTAEDMAMAMRKSPEGGYIRGNPKSVSQVKDGGLLPDMIPGAQFFSDQWQNATGNLAMAAGSGDIGKTATAFEGLMGRVQGFLDFLRSRVEKCATADMRVRAWFLANHPMLKRKVPYTIGQGSSAMTTDIMVAGPNAQVLDGEADHILEGEHEDFDIKVRAYSMQYTNPAIQAQQLMEFTSTVLPAIMQLAGAGLDARMLIRTLARKLNEPTLENLLPDPLIQQMQQQQAMMQQQVDQDPSGQGLNQNPSDAGPAGRRLPGGRTSPRPMDQPQPMRMGPRTPSFAA